MRLSLEAIEKIFGIRYTGVSRGVSAVAKRIEEEQRLREKAEKILDAKVKT